MKMECTYCGNIVEEDQVPTHAGVHFDETQGVDWQGNQVASTLRVDFMPVDR